jgi:secreted Zn-dependent insulinase-like peptidase
MVVIAVQELTNYQFDCEPRALHGALDRFAQFFLAPLCKADALEREVSAVDNEFAGKLGHISWAIACDCCAACATLVRVSCRPHVLVP